MERLPFRKARHYFDTAPHPSHVTFDDGLTLRRNLSWMHFAEARWEYAEPELITVEIGDWVVLLNGYNLGPLFAAIEEHTLLRVRAQPGLQVGHDGDSFVLQLRFVRPDEVPPGLPQKAPGAQLPLGLR